MLTFQARSGYYRKESSYIWAVWNRSLDIRHKSLTFEAVAVDHASLPVRAVPLPNYWILL